MTRRMLDAPVPGKRQKGKVREDDRKPGGKKRYMESIGLTEDDVLDSHRTKWNYNDIQNHPGHPS